jgi:hypothetical protein
LQKNGFLGGTTALKWLGEPEEKTGRASLALKWLGEPEEKTGRASLLKHPSRSRRDISTVNGRFPTP